MMDFAILTEDVSGGLQGELKGTKQNEFDSIVVSVAGLWTEIS
jgi:hypothetical protein